MRGLLTPYRTKYADEAGLKINIKKESMELSEETIVNWHYVTVRALITDNPEKYRSLNEELKISSNSVFSPKELYNRLEVEDDNNIVEKFKSIQND